jgi:hypothetical protein
MIQFIVILIILYFIFNLDPPNTNVGSMGYKSKNFGMSHGMSYNIVNEMKRRGMPEESIKEFIQMEDRFLESERKAVCSQTSRQFEAVGMSDKIKRKFRGYDFSYHAKHIKQASEPEKIINEAITCSYSN